MRIFLVAKVSESIFAVLLKKCRVGQGVKTPPFHGGITGSNPVRGTGIKNKSLVSVTFKVFLCCWVTVQGTFQLKFNH